jgi:hypothetical protein
VTGRGPGTHVADSWTGPDPRPGPSNRLLRRGRDLDRARDTARSEHRVTSPRRVAAAIYRCGRSLTSPAVARHVAPAMATRRHRRGLRPRPPVSSNPLPARRFRARADPDPAPTCHPTNGRARPLGYRLGVWVSWSPVRVKGRKKTRGGRPLRRGAAAGVVRWREAAAAGATARPTQQQRDGDEPSLRRQLFGNAAPTSDAWSSRDP